MLQKIEVEKLTQELKTKNEQLKQAQQQLQLAQEQIVAQEKLADLGTRTAEVVHDLQNPLHYINFFAQLSSSSVDELKGIIGSHSQYLDTKVVENVDEILSTFVESMVAITQQATKASKVINSILVKVRDESYEQELFRNSGQELAALNELIESSSAVAYLSFEDKYADFNISLGIECASSIEQIEVEQDISRALTNLVENACYAVYNKKKAIGNSFEPTVSLKAEDLGDSVKITIKDNGQGIPQEMLEKIFDSRFTTKPAGEGTGLGLSIAREIIEKYGGNIKVESELGAYTKFVVTLPKSY